VATQDELLLTLRQIGADDLADGIEHAADSLDKLSDAQDEVNAKSNESAAASQKQVRGLADLKAGLDIAGKAFGKVKDFIEDSINSTVAYAAETRDLGRAIGSSAEEASALIQVADDVKVSTGTLEAAFKAAIKNGIRPSIDSLAALSDQYLSIQDPVQRSQFAMEKFGRAGLDMGKLLEQGSDAIRASAREAKNLGLVLSEQDVKAARQLEINLDNLNDRVDAFKTKVGNALIPALNQAADSFTALSEGVSETGDQTEKELTQAIAQAVLAFGAESSQVRELSDALREYLLIRQQVAMTDQEHALRTAMAQVRTLEVTRGAGDETIEYILAEEAAMKKAAQAADAQAAAMKRNAESQAAASKAAADAVLNFESIASSLKNASEPADYANVALKELQDKLTAGEISASQYAAAYQTLGLQTGIVSTQSLAATRGIETVNKAFADGLINAEQYATAIQKVPTAAQDGVVTLEEVGIKTSGALKKTKQDLLDETDSAVKQTTGAVSESVSKSMLIVANATGAAESNVKKVSDAVKSLPEYRKIVLEIEVKGKIPELPGRAMGGPVSAGQPYLVGEMGPEVIVPSQGGMVIPNVTNNYTHNTTITTDKMGVALAIDRTRYMADARM